MQLEHPAIERLSAYLEQELSVSEQADVAAHLLECADCRAELGSLERALGGLRALPELEAPAGFSARVMERIEAEEQKGFWAFIKRWKLAPVLAPVAAATLAVVILRDADINNVDIPAVDRAEQSLLRHSSSIPTGTDIGPLRPASPPESETARKPDAAWPSPAQLPSGERSKSEVALPPPAEPAAEKYPARELRALSYIGGSSDEAQSGDLEVAEDMVRNEAGDRVEKMARGPAPKGALEKTTGFGAGAIGEVERSRTKPSEESVENGYVEGVLAGVGGGSAPTAQTQASLGGKAQPADQPTQGEAGRVSNAQPLNVSRPKPDTTTVAFAPVPASAPKSAPSVSTSSTQQWTFEGEKTASESAPEISSGKGAWSADKKLRGALLERTKANVPSSDSDTSGKEASPPEDDARGTSSRDEVSTAARSMEAKPKKAPALEDERTGAHSSEEESIEAWSVEDESIGAPSSEDELREAEPYDEAKRERKTAQGQSDTSGFAPVPGSVAAGTAKNKAPSASSSSAARPEGVARGAREEDNAAEQEPDLDAVLSTREEQAASYDDGEAASAPGEDDQMSLEPGASGRRADAKDEKPPDAVVVMLYQPNLLAQVKDLLKELKATARPATPLPDGGVRVRATLRPGTYSALLERLQKLGKLGATPLPNPQQTFRDVAIDIRPSP